MSYKDVKLKTPVEFTGKFKDAKTLVIATGPSTRKILPYKNKLKDYFDCIIIINKSYLNFDDIADFHVISEKTSEKNKMNTVRNELNAGNYRLDLPRIINWKGIDLYSSKLNRYKIQRHWLNHRPNIRSYYTDEFEGLYIGPVGPRGLSLGTSVLPISHFAGIIGSKEIYLIGADLMFKDKFDHYYNDILYRGTKIRKKDIEMNPIVEVEHKGKKCQTLDYFRDSAEYIKEATKTIFKDITFYDFSDGLIDIENKLDVDKFFGK